MDTITFTQSLSLLKNLTRAVVSNIAFLRGLVPQDGFKEVKVDTLKVWMLDEYQTEIGDRVISWLDNGAFVALEKGYLQSMHFEIRGCRQQLLERYILNFFVDKPASVKCDGNTNLLVQMPSSKPMTKAKLKSEMVNALRSLLVLSSTMKDLPQDEAITVSMRLLYNETCPDSFEPPKFKRAIYEPCPMENADNAFSIKLGEVVTPSHGVTVNVDISESLMEDDHHEDVESAQLENWSMHNDAHGTVSKPVAAYSSTKPKENQRKCDSDTTIATTTQGQPTRRSKMRMRSERKL